MTITLVTGGARSGKSRFAEYLAGSLSEGKSIGYIATGIAVDSEMAQRIEQHRDRRSSSFVTIEKSCEVASCLARAEHSLYLVDCLSFLLNNWLYEIEYSEIDIQKRIVELIETIRTISSDVIFVTNEVGMGLVPPSRESRIYRDWLGWLNQSIAREADELYLVVSGYAMNLKEIPGVRKVP